MTNAEYDYRILPPTRSDGKVLISMERLLQHCERLREMSILCVLQGQLDLAATLSDLAEELNNETQY